MLLLMSTGGKGDSAKYFYFVVECKSTPDSGSSKSQEEKAGVACLRSQDQVFSIRATTDRIICHRYKKVLDETHNPLRVTCQRSCYMLTHMHPNLNVPLVTDPDEFMKLFRALVVMANETVIIKVL